MGDRFQGIRDQTKKWSEGGEGMEGGVWGEMEKDRPFQISFSYSKNHPFCLKKQDSCQADTFNLFMFFLNIIGHSYSSVLSFLNKKETLKAAEGKYIKTHEQHQFLKKIKNEEGVSLAFLNSTSVSTKRKASRSHIPIYLHSQPGLKERKEQDTQKRVSSRKLLKINL